MSKLFGSLEGVDLSQSMRLLGQLHATGCLKVSRGEWVGEIAFEDGRVIAATVGTQSGVTALTMILLALDGGELGFEDASRPAQRNIDMGANELLAYLETVASLGSSQPQIHRSSENSAIAGEPESGHTPTPNLVLDPDRVAALLEHSLTGPTAAKPNFAGPPQDESSAATPASPVASRATSLNGGPASAPMGRNGYHRQVASGTARAGSNAAESPATPQQVCSKIGFPDQPTYHYSRPVRLHNCFAGPTQRGVPLKEQAEICFTDKFRTCPRYVAAMGPPIAPGLDAASSSCLEPPEQPLGQQSEKPSGRERLAGTTPPGPSAAAVASPEPADAVALPSIRTRLETSQTADLPPNGVSARASVGQQWVSTIRKTAPRLPVWPVAQRPTTEAPPAPEPTVDAVREHTADQKPTHSMPGVAPVTRPVSLDPAPDEDTESQPLPPARGRRWALLELRWILLSLPITFTIVGVLILAALTDPKDLAWPDVPEQRPPSARLAASPAAALPTVGLAASPVAALPAAGPRVGASSDVDRGERESAATALPTEPPSQSGSGSSPAAASSNGSLGGAAALRTVFDERFADNRSGWPNNPQSTGWLNDNAYRLLARQPSQFVALGAPLTVPLRDVIVTASFRKVGGPPGGGYGLIVRDQGPGPRDGSSQSGRYYVLETSDRGEVGIWRRQNDRWIDLLPWTASEAVRQETGANQLTVQAIGQRLTFLVNGTQVASLTDDALAEGGVGVFVGGDFNEVALDSFRVEARQ